MKALLFSAGAHIGACMIERKRASHKKGKTQRDGNHYEKFLKRVGGQMQRPNM